MDAFRFMSTIKRAFRNQRIKQIEIAEKMGVSDKMISKYLNCNTYPDIKQTLKLLDMAGLDIIIRNRHTNVVVLADNRDDQIPYDFATREEKIDRVMKQLYELLNEKTES